MSKAEILPGGGWVPVGSPVFKIGGGRFEAAAVGSTPTYSRSVNAGSCGPTVHAMQIQLNWEDQPPHIVDAIVYPYPDLRRLWLRVALSSFAEYPNLDAVVRDADGQEVAALAVIEVRDQELSQTLHLRQAPRPDARYHVELVLSRGDLRLDEHRFDFTLTFVDPDGTQAAG